MTSERADHKIIKEAEGDGAPGTFPQATIAPVVLEDSEKASGDQPTPGPSEPSDRSLSARILHEMSELREEVARLRDSGVENSRTESVAPPDYDTLSQAHS